MANLSTRLGALEYVLEERDKSVTAPLERSVSELSSAYTLFANNNQRLINAIESTLKQPQTDLLQEGSAVDDGQAVPLQVKLSTLEAKEADIVNLLDSLNDLSGLQMPNAVSLVEKSQQMKNSLALEDRVEASMRRLERLSVRSAKVLRNWLEILKEENEVWAEIDEIMRKKQIESNQSKARSEMY